AEPEAAAEEAVSEPEATAEPEAAEPVATAAGAATPTYEPGAGVFVRKRGFFRVASVRIDGSMELASTDPAADGLLDYDAEEVARLFRPAVDAQLARDYEAMLRRPLIGMELPEDPAVLAARVDEVMAVGELGAMVGVLRDLYGQPAAALDKVRLQRLEDAVFGELGHVLGLDVAELREAARDQTPAFGTIRPPVRPMPTEAAAMDSALEEGEQEGEPVAEEPAVEDAPEAKDAAPEPAVDESPAGAGDAESTGSEGPEGVPAGWRWRGAVEVTKGVVVGSRVGSEHDKDKVRGAVYNLRPLSRAGTWHLLEKDGALCLVHADHVAGVDALAEQARRLGRLVVEGEGFLVVDKARRDDAALLTALEGGQAAEGGLRLDSGGAERVEVQVARDGRVAVFLAFRPG
ncbi:MAG: hypothetical protein D6798_02145, partial [Deltaproteobacteria bacterium]